ncbi:hypothetical protein GCM10020331_006010 [Ectobacillus funiculus]
MNLNRLLTFVQQKVLDGVRSPLLNPKDFDLIVVRENSEGEYSSVGGKIYQGEDEIAIQNAIFFKKKGQKGLCVLLLN